jgi:methionine-rich copper-binding protein CopC
MSRTNKRITLPLLFCLCCSVLIALLLTPAVALAHAEYERSDPQAGSVIPTPPAEVHIWFTQELFRRQGENSIEVIGPDGSAVHAGEAQIDDDDRTHLWVALQDGLGTGEYLVRWRNLSAEDGDNDEGEFSFTVDPDAPEATQPPATATAEPPPTLEPSATGALAATPTSQPASGLPCLGSALLGLGAIALAWRRRR